jgi:DNA-binding NtrC family response regulator
MRIRKRILLVEPDDVRRGLLEGAAGPVALLESHRNFETARARLFHAPFDFLITNLRLGPFNGLHLVYLSSSGDGAPRAIVYSDERDAGLAREVQRAGAFYEVGACLPVTLAGYVKGTLPDHDRRDPAIADRRGVVRGGRRCWDSHLHSSQNLRAAPVYRRNRRRSVT